MATFCRRANFNENDVIGNISLGFHSNTFFPFVFEKRKSAKRNGIEVYKTADNKNV